MSCLSKKDTNTTKEEERAVDNLVIVQESC